MMAPEKKCIRQEEVDGKIAPALSERQVRLDTLRVQEQVLPKPE